MHCTVTRQQVQRDGYLEEFARLWSANPNVRQIWFSLYTPQIGEVSPRDPAAARSRARHRGADGAAPAATRRSRMPEGLRQAVRDAAAAAPTSASSRRRRAASRPTSSTASRPCQFGGNPDCSQCGCIASAGLEAVGAHRLPGGIRVGAIFETSLRIGRRAAQPARGGRPDGAGRLLRHHVRRSICRRSTTPSTRRARKSRSATTSRARARRSSSIRARTRIVLTADDEFKMNALWEILQTRMVRRGVPTKNLTPGDDRTRRQRHRPAGGHAPAGHPDRGRQGHRQVPEGQEAEEGAGRRSWPTRCA